MVPPSLPHFLPNLMLLCAALGCSGPDAVVRPTPPPPASCALDCSPSFGCLGLDNGLVKARALMVKCVGDQASKGHISRAHRCYRAARLLESARWWLTTLQVPDHINKVYQPSPSRHRAFLCSIQRLGKCSTATEVEQRYLEMIKYYP
jgi:hypothetical protein